LFQCIAVFAVGHGILFIALSYLFFGKKAGEFKWNLQLRA
jgi:hypothetical protein